MAAKDFESGFDDSSGDDEESGLDLDRVRELVGFARRAPRRHPRLSISLLIAGLVATAASVVLIPRTYSTQARLLAQRNFVLPALGNPNRSVPRDADNPTKNVADVVTERDNLVALVKQVDLLDRWDNERPRALRAKDALAAMLSQPPSEDDKLRAIVGVVEKKLTVTAEETSVTIAVDWTDPEMAYELASTVQKNFLDAKYDADVGMINDAIAILQKHLAVENDNIGTALLELRSAQGSAKTGTPSADAATGPASGGAPTHASLTSAKRPATAAPSRDAELAPLLEERRAQIKKLQDAHDQQVGELNRQMTNALATLTPAHPTVLALKSQLEEAEKDPPELAAAKNDERAIVGQIAAASGAERPTQAQNDKPPGDATSNASVVSPVRPPTTPANEDPGVGVARYKLQSATQKFTELEARIESARIELDVARAAFKYRFSVVHPAEVPHKPTKPNVPVLLIGGLLASFGLAIAAAVLADLLGGKFIEESQVRRRLKLPLLGEIDAP